MEWKEVSAGRGPAAGKGPKDQQRAGRPNNRPARAQDPQKPPADKRRSAAPPPAKQPPRRNTRPPQPSRPTQGGTGRPAIGGAGPSRAENPPASRGAVPPGRKRTPPKPKRLLRPGFFIGLGLVVVLVLVVLSLTVLFPVRGIEVVGETRYTSEQIEQVSALKTGDNLLLADTDTAVSRILQQLPYIGEVSISRKLPGTLVIEAVEAGPAYALETDEQYLLINDKNKVVDSTLQKQAGLPLIRGMQIASAEKGGQVSFADADQAKLLQNLLERLKNQGLQITLIDLREPVQIRFVIDNRILVEFGSSTDMDKKLTHMIATYEKLEAGAAGTLDLTWWTSSKKDAYFKEEALSDEWLVPAASEGGEDPSAPNP